MANVRSISILRCASQPISFVVDDNVYNNNKNNNKTFIKCLGGI